MRIIDVRVFLCPIQFLVALKSSDDENVKEMLRNYTQIFPVWNFKAFIYALTFICEYIKMQLLI